MDIKQQILKYALQNAVKFNGKANSGAVLGKILAENPKLKDKVKEIKKEIEKIVGEVNRKKLEKQIEELKKIAPELLEEKKKEEKKELPELKNAKNVVMRFEPSPSGPLHIGHAYVLSLNYAYCKKYKGKLILRIADTNPENIDPQAYSMIPEDANWLTMNGISETVVQSDRMKIYYDYAEKLISLEKAYVCTCHQERFKEFSDAMKECPCRNIPKKENIERWRKMFNEFKEGEAALRIKTDIKHKNPALRDFVAMRICDREHARQGTSYRVWPTMNFAVAIDDIEMKVSHTLRGKDHYDNAKKQEYIYKYLNKKPPQNIFLGRINFIDMEVSCSKTRPLIEAKEYSGWDDIRLPFLAALRRRGYKPEALLKFALDMGVNMHDKTISKEEFFKILDSHNRNIIEPIANRYFFVEDPVEIDIKNAPGRMAEVNLHPDFPERGKRVFKTAGRFYVTKDDFEQIKENKLYRLMDCLNFIKKGKEFLFDSLEYEKFKEKGEKIIHWIPVDKSIISVKVLMPDGKIKRGFAEEGIKGLKIGDVCQFERFGFVRLDSIENGKYIFWFIHK